MNNHPWFPGPQTGRGILLAAVMLAGCNDGPGPTPVPDRRQPAVPGVSNPIVEPLGPFRVSGSVKMAGVLAYQAAVAGARVEVTGGTGAGNSAMTTEEGWYALEGVAGAVTIRVTKDGFVPAELKVTVASEATLPVIGLSPAVAVADLQGTYTLTLRAASDCPATGDQALPSHLRTRQYTATLVQAGSRLDVKLSGTTFILTNSDYWGIPEIVGNGFQGYLSAGQAVFILRGPGPNSIWEWSEAPDLYEHTGQDRLVITGIATARPGETIAGTLNGSFLAPLETTMAFCESEHHQFVLSR